MAIQLVKLNVTGARGPTGPTGPTGGSGNSVASKSALKAIDASNGDTWLLGASGIYGVFTWRTGDYSVQVASDPREGIYIASTVSGKGATVGCWVRQWDEINGRSEWFGAQVNNGDLDCGAPINAAIALCPVVELGAGIYWVTTTIKLNKSNRVLRGTGQQFVTNNDEATRILTSSATLNPVQVGADSFPGSVNNYIRAMRLEDVYVGRTTGPDKTAKPAGVLMQYCLGAELNRVKSVDSTYSFRITGIVACYVRSCNANRVVAGTGSGTDEWTGYLLDGTPNIGLAGGNASLYIIETQAGCNISDLQSGISYGYRTIGKPQDLFMDKPESVSCNVGISLESTGSGDADIKIDTPIMDAFFKWGIYVSSLSAQSTVNIINPYLAFNSSSQFGLYFLNCLGQYNVIGGELLAGGFAGQGVAISASKGVTLDAFQIKECGAIGVGTAGTCTNLRIATVHHNPTVTGGPVVQLNGTAAEACVVDAIAFGKASAFTFGIQVVGAIDARNSYSMTGFDSGCISGGSANKLVRNGVQITATGVSGTNYVDGVMT